MKKTKFIIGIIIVSVILFIRGTPDPEPSRESERDLWWKSEFPAPVKKDGKVYDGVIDGFFLDEKWSRDIIKEIHPDSGFSLSSSGATVEYFGAETDGTSWTQIIKNGESLQSESRPTKLHCRVLNKPSRAEMWPRLIIVVNAPQ